MSRAGRAGRPAPARKPSAVRLILFAIATVASLGLVIIAATAAILLSGATEVGLIRDRVEAALADRIGPDFSVRVGRAVMLVDPELGLAVDIEAIEATNIEGRQVIAVPTVRLGIDALSLLGLNVAVTGAKVSGANLALAADAGGGLRLDGGAPGVPETSRPATTAPASGEGTDGLHELASAVEGLDRMVGEIVGGERMAGISLDLSEGRVTVRDPASAAVRAVDDITLHAAVDDASTLRVEVSARGSAGRWSATLKRPSNSGETGERVLNARFSQITMRDVFPALATADGTVSAEMPLYGGFDFSFSGDRLSQVSARLEVGAGVFQYGSAGEGILLDEASLTARWDVGAGEIVVGPASIHAGQTGGTFGGVVRGEGGKRYGFAFESRDAILAPRDSDEEPLATELIELSGTADLAAQALDLDRVIIQTPEGGFAGAARLGFAGESPSLAVAAELTAMPIAAWNQMWPPFLAPGARAWALENILGGRIASARFDASVPAGVLFRPEPPSALDAEAFRLDLRLEDVTVRTFGGLPPVTAASGQAVLAGSTFGIDVETGRVTTPSGATVAVDAGAFAIDDVFDPESDGVIEVQLSGDVAAIGEIANSDPFLVLDRRGLSPADLSGVGEVSVSVKVPLELPEGEDPDAAVDWRVVLAGKGLASKAPVDGRRFSNADVTITVGKTEVTVEGSAEIDGVPAVVSIAQPLTLDGAEAPGGRQAASLALDRDARLKLGLDIESIVSGVVDAEVRSLPGGGDHYDLDLRRARLVIPGLGWSKGIGVPATMTFDVIAAKGGSLIENMELSGEGFGFAGTARLGDGEGLVSASVTKFRLRPGDDVSFELKARDGGYAIVADGTSFDIRGVIAELKGEVEDGGETSDITVEANVRKLRGFGDRAITGAKVSFAAREGVPRVFTLSGTLRGGAVSLDYRDDLADAALKASAADAGAVFEFLDVYGRVGGGHLAIVAERPAPTGPLAGTLSMTGFAILNEPAMEQVISRAGPRNGAKIDTTRMHVEQMDAVFRYTGDEIFVDDAFLRGAAMGATFNGVFDLVRSAISISGTYIPIYGINNAFSRLPVVGRILGGENAEGLIGVTFKVEGPIDEPRVFVNPLSAVAPGMFRKIFEFR